MLMVKKLFKPALLAALFFFFAASCSDRMPVPRKVMQRIYFDMMLADSFVETEPHARMASDSIAVYPPLIEKYGYTVEQFLASQEILLKDPEKMSKIFEANKKTYHDSAVALMARIHLRDSLADVAFEEEQAAQVAMDELLDSLSFACMMDTLLVSFVGDSLVIDTLFLHPRDSVAAGSAAREARDDEFTGDTEETPEEIDMEFKEIEEEIAKSRNVSKEERATELKNSKKFRIFGGKKKKDNMPDRQQLKEIEEKFK